MFARIYRNLVAGRRHSTATSVVCLCLAASCSRDARDASQPPLAPAAALSNPALSNPALSNAPRWHLVPDEIEPDVEELDETGVRRLIREGMRVLDRPDGAVELAEQVFPTGEVAPQALPQRLGGGYLFRSEVSGETLLWHAPSWLADARPVAALNERVERIVAGFDRVYLQLAHTQEVVAFDLESGALVDVGPLPPSHTYAALAFVDEWFGVVHTDLRGLLASFDAGETWQPLGVDASADVQLEALPNAVRLQLGRRRSRLTRSGELTLETDTDIEQRFSLHNDEQLAVERDGMPEPRSVYAGIALPLGPRPLQLATLHGWPLGDGSAVVASNGALGRVKLADGHLLEHTPNAYAGSDPCRAVSYGAGIGFVCSEPGRGTQIYRFEPPLALRRVAHFATPRRVSPSGNGALVVGGSCDGEAATSARGAAAGEYCTSTGDGIWRPVQVRGDLGAERVVALRDGRAVVLVPPRFGSAGTLSIVGDAVATRELRLPDAEPKTPPGKSEAKRTQRNGAEQEKRDGARSRFARMLRLGTWLDGVTQLDDDTLATWVADGTNVIGVKVRLDGSVVLPRGEAEERGDLTRTVLSGGHALEVSAAGVGFHTADYGFRWQRITLPRVLSPLAARQLQRETGTRPSVGCSQVGCSYPPWLLVGHPEANTGERAPESPELVGIAEPREADAPPRVTSTSPAYADWRLECRATGERRGVAGALERSLVRGDGARPRSGLSLGYPKALPTASSNPQIESGAYRPFWGVPGPQRSSVAARRLLLDMGHEKPVDFRAYAWGDPGETWTKNSAWVVRVATRFGPAPIWSTAVTRTPWSDWVSSAQLFGADRASRHSTEWLLQLDVDETSGVLWTNSRGTTELHLLGSDKVISSFYGVTLGKPISVAKVAETHYVATRDGASLSLHAITGGHLSLVRRYPVGHGTRATLVRTADARHLGILLHSARGNWFVHPLDREFVPGDPIVVGREQLNRTAPACNSESEGWLIRSELPLSRLGEGNSGDVLTFAGPHSDWRAFEVATKVLVSQDQLCAVELAATLRNPDARPSRGPRAEDPKSAGIPLTLSDPSGRQHLSFRCAP